MTMKHYEHIAPIVREAGRNLLPYFGNATSLGSKSASAGDVVTQLDKDTEVFLKERLTEYDSSIGFVGEEFGGERGDRFWLVDPIDGTQFFMRGMPMCTVMVALVEYGEVTFSLIYDFVNDRMYAAEKGSGAYCNDDPIAVSSRPLPEAMYAFAIPTDHQDYIPIRTTLDSTGAVSMQASCSGFMMSMVASGKVDVRIFMLEDTKVWDHAPGSLLVREAGGVVTNLGSTSYDFRNSRFIAGNPVVHKELTEGEDALFPVGE